MGNILGLDLGTNSIGWSVVDIEKEKILGLGSRIIPMSQDIIGNFEKGNSISQTAERTRMRGARRLLERHLLRRQRLHRVLHILGFLPEHYEKCIDFTNRLGQFIDDAEPKLAYNGRDFIFKKSFEEMLIDFRQKNPTLFYKKSNGEETRIPYDWTIYYLRKKALQQKIEKEELAWIILNFNKKRGYYQARGEEEEDKLNRLVEFHSLRVIDVKADEHPNSKGETWYYLHLENGWIYRRSSKVPLFEWKDKVRDFIVTTELNNDGSVKKDKEGNEKRSFRAPSNDDWTLLKTKTEKDINKTNKTVGTYIYENLLSNPNSKVRGNLVKTIERNFYRDELTAMLKKQIELQPELFSDDLYNDCIRELYRSNEGHRLILSKRGFEYLFIDDIIFYQRPLKSLKSSISDCSFESRCYKGKDGKNVKEFLKAIPKSHPLYQEFRIWEWISNLRIYNNETNKDITSEIIESWEVKEKLFDFLNTKKEINQKGLLKYFGLNEKEYRWNFVEDNTYPCNETRNQFRTRLSKVKDLPTDFLTNQIERDLWHIIYSVNDKIEYSKALGTFAQKHNLDEESFVENFKKFPPFKSDYGSFSEKAIKRLLSLMRIGKYWKWESIDTRTRKRINTIITGEADTTINDIVREKANHLTSENQYQGLPLWLASYIVYDTKKKDKWESPEDIDNYLKNEFKQYSLNNPIVEQVITETLRVVRDIWTKYGKIDEIHIELGRELKKNAEQREKLYKKAKKNEDTNMRIKALIMELKNNSDGKLDVKNVNPYSSKHQELLKIYEKGVIYSHVEIPKDISEISDKAQPTHSEILRYKLWLDQKYVSPYTGNFIKLGELFTSKYNIEHIIPQSIYFDDSFNNKIICETSVNERKGNQLGLEFIKNHHGEIIDSETKIRSVDDYIEFVKKNYAKSENKIKRDNLLREEIPEKFISRQLNDTRYISRKLMELLSNIVREDNEKETVSKNIRPTIGEITSRLKSDWGLDAVWNSILIPRFERMNHLTKSNDFTVWNEQLNKYLPAIPINLSRGFQKKRLDHRHHAMDALVIACTTHNIINILNRHSANKNQNDNDSNGEEKKNINLSKKFSKPWKNFTVDAKNELNKIVVSFKHNQRIITKTKNKYSAFEDGKKVIKIQSKGDNWAIRKSLHKDTQLAKVSLQKIKKVKLSEALNNLENIVNKEFRNEIHKISKEYGKYDPATINKYFKDRKYQFKNLDISKVEIYYYDTENAATRKSLDTSFNEKNIKDSITDSGIQKILLNYLASKNNNPEIAFCPEGIEELNQNISIYNGGKYHQPIKKVRVYEIIGNKFQVGYKGNKKKKYVEAAQGTNLFFGIYADKDGKRSFETIPLNIVIERLKQGLQAIPQKNDKGLELLFHISPNDLVYVPTEEERVNGINLKPQELSQDRIYKMVSCTGKECHFVRHDIAIPIVNKVEFFSLNKMAQSLTGEMIKEICVKIDIDRLGTIKSLL